MEGLVAEAGSSVTFVNKMGLAKANEVLLLGHKQSAQELLRINFVQSVSPPKFTWSFPEGISVRKLFPSQPAESFHKAVREHIKQELDGLNPVTLLKVRPVSQNSFRSHADICYLLHRYLDEGNHPSWYQ